MARALEILVIEDDVPMQKMIEMVFKSATLGEYLVRRAGSLAEGIKATMGVTPDLILLDLDLPDAKGLEGLRALLALAPQAAIVILTASLDEVMAVEAIKLGAQDWLRKVDGLQRGLPRAVTFAVERQHIRRALLARLAAVGETPEG
ncbi:MAG: response regulator [Gemmatimonadetes bacterium]|nr:response regulator [Gemmatimonadota bacterium]